MPREIIDKQQNSVMDEGRNFAKSVVIWRLRRMKKRKDQSEVTGNLRD